ncbi:hypothetical protein [Chryseobacterium sp.]|uniref:hypothetical protein n=1 Tax=Chryseobacterium sp. TaxID=1871047 RepID=UPI0011C802B6|nr:hypothetical protein [Chryseobacterium sp.]TXF79300.1 hypothetical protein FUA25_02625 [Chryseobacterium sp.]
MNNKKCLLLFLICFSQFFFSQKKKKKRDVNTEVAVKILREDGSESSGKMSGVYFPDTNSFAGMIAQSSSKYSIYSNDVKFEFKNDTTGQTENIPFKDLKKIKVLDDFEDEIIGYEKLKIQQFDKDMNIIPKNYEAFVPILYEGKINIYGYDYLTCYGYGNNINTNNCTYSTTMLYIKNQFNPIAFMPIDYDRIGQLAWGSISKRFMAAFREAGKDCTDFQKYLDGIQTQIDENGYAKTLYPNWKAEMKSFRADKNDQNLGVLEKKRAKQKLMRDLYMQPYLGFIKEYEKNCK